MLSNTFLRLPVEELDLVLHAVGGRWERLRGQRLLLTGATGFIGKWLLASFLYANRALGLDAHIVLVSRRPEVFLKKFPELCDAVDISWVCRDIRELEPEDVGGCSYIFHAATDVVATATALDILDTCISGTRRVIDAIIANSTPCRMVLLSSGAVYGRTPPEVQVISEEWFGAPNQLVSASAYGEGKRVSELLCSIAAMEQHGLDVSIARCFAFVGPYLSLNKQFAIGNFIGAAMRGDEILIQGDGTPLRSYLYTTDLANWLWVLLFDAPSGRAYNVGGDESVSIASLAHRVNYLLGSKGKVRIAQPTSSEAMPQAYVPSIHRITTELGLKPTIDLDEAITRTARWIAHSSEQ